MTKYIEQEKQRSRGDYKKSAMPVPENFDIIVKSILFDNPTNKKKKR